MNSQSSIHELLRVLEAERLQTIEECARDIPIASSSHSAMLERVGQIHMAVLAVRDELAAHEPKMGSGSEEPLR